MKNCFAPRLSYNFPTSLQSGKFFFLLIFFNVCVPFRILESTNLSQGVLTDSVFVYTRLCIRVAQLLFTRITFADIMYYLFDVTKCSITQSCQFINLLRL